MAVKIHLTLREMIMLVKFLDYSPGVTNEEIRQELQTFGGKCPDKELFEHIKAKVHRKLQRGIKDVRAEKEKFLKGGK